MRTKWFSPLWSTQQCLVHSNQWLFSLIHSEYKLRLSSCTKSRNHTNLWKNQRIRSNTDPWPYKDMMENVRSAVTVVTWATHLPVTQQPTWHFHLGLYEHLRINMEHAQDTIMEGAGNRINRSPLHYDGNVLGLLNYSKIKGVILIHNNSDYYCNLTYYYVSL